MKVIIKANFNMEYIKYLKQNLIDDSLYFISKNNEIINEMKESEILISYGDGIDEKLVNKLPNLKWIQVLSAGLNLLPHKLILDRRIKLTNVGGIHKIPMAEYVMSVILNITHRMYYYYDLQKEKYWESWIELQEAHGKTIGIIGLGHIGSEIAKYAKSLSMNVLGCRKDYQKQCKYVDKIFSPNNLNQLLNQSDFVVLCLPLTKETENLIDREQLSSMKKTAYLINIARGAIVNEEALITALNNDVIAGAVLDITKQEPLNSDSVLWTTKNIIITPHISGRSPKYLDRALEIVIENFKLYKSKEKLINEFNFKKGY